MNQSELPRWQRHCTPYRFALVAIMLTICGRTLHADELPAGCATSVLDLDGAAELLRVEVIAVESLAVQGDLPGRRVGSSWRFNCAGLMAWLNGEWTAIEQMRRLQSPDLTSSGVRPMEPAQLQSVVGAGIDDQSPDPESTAEARETIGEAPEGVSAEDVLLRNQRVLLAPGRKIVDWGTFFSETDSQPLTFIGGDPVLATVEQESIVSTIQARFGFRNENEIFLGTSYSVQQANAFAGSTRLSSVDGNDFGPFQLGYRRTIAHERTGRPNIIASIDVGIPTGDTSPYIGGGLIFVKSFDPVVMFSSVAYHRVVSRDSDQPFLFEPDERLDFSLGSALALNDTMALSLAFTGSIGSTTQIGDVLLRQQDSYGLRFGLTTLLESGTFIEPSLSFNLNGPNQGFAFGIAIPYGFGR